MQVESLDEMSARTRVGRRCFERVVLCDQHCFWNWPPDKSWLDGLQPSSVAHQVTRANTPAAPIITSERRDPDQSERFVEEPHSSPLEYSRASLWRSQAVELHCRLARSWSTACHLHKVHAQGWLEILADTHPLQSVFLGCR